MAVIPNADLPIIPIAQPVEVDGPELSGRAIALQLDGETMRYLVVPTKEPGPPVWIEEQQIESCFLADSRR